MTDTIKPIAYCCINRQGDITSTIKHKDGWRKAPLYDESATEQARQEGRNEWQEKSKGTFQTAAKNDALTKENDDLRRQLVAAQALILEAAEDIGEWGCYASAYFQAKHNLTGCIEKYRCTDTTVLDALLAQRERETIERCAKVCDVQAGEPECPERAEYCAAAEIGKNM